MKVILIENVNNLGDAGEIKDVAAGYAMNYLIPKNFVIPATASSRKQLLHQQRLVKLKTEKRMGSLQKIQGDVDGLAIEITAKAGKSDKLFGSITAMDISKALAEKGFNIEKRKIEVGSPIREVGNRKINIKLAPGLTAEIKLTVVADRTEVEDDTPLQKPTPITEEDAAKLREQEAAEAAARGEVPEGAETAEEGEASEEGGADAAPAEEAVATETDGAEEAPAAETEPA